MQNMSAWLSALAGFAIGGIAGFAVQRARLCTFGAIEDAVIGGDGRRLKVLGLALGIAVLGTQALVLSGFLLPELTTLVPTALPLVAIVIGSLMFGMGMAMVGTCGFGSLVRLGTGDLKGLVVILVLGATAYATLRGLFADLRIGVIEPLSIQMPDGIRTDLASWLSQATGHDLRLPLAVLIGGSLCWLALTDKRLRRAPRLLTAGATLGLLIVASWIVTTGLNDDFAGPPRPQGLTFVSTIGKALYAGVLNAANFADFGVGSVFGVVAGAWVGAWSAAELRWEAFDDDHEMRRHLLGACLMGVGGILAGGCVIGQGLTAGSLLALSWPVALAGIVLGARVGIAILMDGSPIDIIQRNWTLLARKTPFKRAPFE